MSWLYSPLLLGAAQQEAGAGAVFADAVALMTGASELLAIAASSGIQPAEEQPVDLSGGGAGALHPDLMAPKKKRKPRVIRLGETEGSQLSAEAQAEADFRILWESVRIRDNPRRLEAVVQKRAAMLADLDQATLIRKAS